MHRYGLVAFLRFLELEGDGDCIRLGDVVGGVGNYLAFHSKTEVAEAESACPTVFFGLRCREVLARAHREEKCAGA